MTIFVTRNQLETKMPSPKMVQNLNLHIYIYTRIYLSFDFNSIYYIDIISIYIYSIHAVVLRHTLAMSHPQTLVKRNQLDGCFPTKDGSRGILWGCKMSSEQGPLVACFIRELY